MSSQTDSQEEFVCSNEHLSYTCELSGNLLIWTLKGMSSSGGESYISNNLTFGSSDPVGHAAFNTPPTELEAVAFLIRNIDGKLRSALFLTYAPTIFGDTISSIVQCSSRNDSDTIWIGTAGSQKYNNTIVVMTVIILNNIVTTSSKSIQCMHAYMYFQLFQTNQPSHKLNQ